MWLVLMTKVFNDKNACLVAVMDMDSMYSVR